MTFSALSDKIEPIGPPPTLTPQTPIATPVGYRPAGSLQRGDTVHTQAGEVVPVLQRSGYRAVPARGSYAPIRIRAPYFGLQKDIVLPPEQRPMVDGREVEYLFATESVLTPARHLINEFAALADRAGPTIRYIQLILPRHETMPAAGATLESLYIGRIRRNHAQMDAGILAGTDRNTLPGHGRAAHKVLKWFEAITLASGAWPNACCKEVPVQIPAVCRTTSRFLASE